MKSKTYNLLSIVAAFGMIGGGILAIYNEDSLNVALGIYFIAKGLFVMSLMQSIRSKSCCNCNQNKS
jgi:hypothetical protein